MGMQLAKNLKALTSLRYFAAIWVVGFHFLEYLPQSHWLQRTFFSDGVVAVDFFFVLSGFILAHTYIGEMEGRRLHYLDFLVKRFARIYPAHLFMLMTFIGFAFLSVKLGIDLQNPDRYRASAILPNLLLIHAWGVSPRFSFNYPSWSISAEWMAYILFPVLAGLALLLRRAFGKLTRPEVWTAVAALALLLLVWWAYGAVTGRSITGLTTRYVYLRILPEFFLGVCLYLVARKGGRCGYWTVGGLALVVPMLSQVGAPHVAIVLACAALVLAAALATRGTGSGLLDHRFLVYLGEISYGLYMIHIFLAALLFKAVELSPVAVDPLITFVGGIVVTTALASAFHRIVETPGRSLILMVWKHVKTRFRGKSAVGPR